MPNSSNLPEGADEAPTCRNRWHLYEWLKQQYMGTGHIPTPDQARAAMPELPLEEMGEGYTEFMAVVGRYEKGA
ncbi:hypothetical protein J19TS2_31160 [Cohnella xylanilytica]|uniref:hypothetical protein n=1 Tax=Cohnella xylanilytica TaxID=557555 RepID=UPI001B1FA94B|nr:hypothetical protein [Cohnella xylanilytica]GIO13561.1 hypothetical protein J19TS2_31160 [Cohnella xylanilytica]